MSDLPRILLLTWCAPDSPYAGGEVLRRIVCRMPSGTLRWIGLAAPRRLDGLAGIDWRAVPSRPVHWRLQDGELGHWWAALRDVPRMALEVEEAARAYKPEVLWVLGELTAVGVGLRVAKRLRIPLHVTMHDAPEESRFSGLPDVYGYFYRRSVRKLLRSALSVDTVSPELFRHLADKEWVNTDCRGVTLPPSVPVAWMTPRPSDSTAECRRFSDTPVRRIGMCGSLRIGMAQWRSFLDLLGSLPFRIEIVLFGNADDLGTEFPRTVTVNPQPYAASEETVISTFRSQVDACYLGLWREPERALFARTSLSSKLVSYVAAGRPVIVDAPVDSVAWRLVRQYGAGILLRGECGARGEEAGTGKLDGQRPGGDGRQGLAAMAQGAEGRTRDTDEPDGDRLTRLFSDDAQWLRMAEGARRLCQTEFNLDENVQRLMRAQWHTAGFRDSNEAVGESP